MHNLFPKKLKNIGDAGEVVFDHNNPNNVYMVTFMTNYYGRRSVDGGQTFPNDSVYNFTITDPKRRNDAPLEISKNNSKRLYIGGLDVWRTVDGFVTNPVKISNLVKNDQTHIAIKTIREAKSNSNVLYVARDNPHWNCNESAPNCDRRRIFKTMNGLSDAPDWIDITPSTTYVPLGEAAISDLAVNPYNAHEFYISMTRGIPGKQVYKGSGTSTISWESISSGLPALPVNCLLYRYGSTLNELFAGTDAGVYYRNDSLDSWVPFGNGMPLTVISDLEIDYATNELYASTFGRGIYKASLCFDPNNVNPITITNNQVWNDKIISSDIIINSGAELTIKGTVQMGTDNQVLVQKGGKLILDGGRLTNNECLNKPWKGITVQGTASGTQNHTDQGFVHLFNGAIIENAYIGIHCVNPAIPIDGGGTVEDPNYLPTGGGIILAYDSKFINNQVAVQFEKYDKYSMSRFERCSFEQDNEVMTSAFLKYFIRLNQVKSINILGCAFVSDFVYGTATNSKPTYGIYSNNSSFMVDRKCMDTDCNNFLNSSFEGLKYGIYALSKTGGMTFSVKHTNFTKNRRGIYASSTNNLNISHNHFSFKKMAPLALSDTIAGIYLDKCTGYIVEENELTNIENPPPVGFITYGIYINNSGETNNMVYKNTVYNCNYGITAQDKNRNKDGSAGLTIKCNRFYSIIGNDLLIASSVNDTITHGIARNQGTDTTDCKAPAGNQFAHFNSNQSSIWNGGNRIIYHHHDPFYLSKLEPINPYRTTLNNTRLPFNYETCCPSNNQGGGIALSMNAETHEYKQQSLEYANSLEIIVDGGDTELKVAELNSTLPEDALLLRNDLLIQSPFLSDTVLKTVIIREDILNNAMVRDILVANPQSAKSDLLISTLDSKFNPFPEYMKDEVMEGIFYLSSKELLESRREMAELHYDYCVNRMLAYNLTDSIQVSYDTLVNFLLEEGGFESKLKLAWMKIENCDTIGALSMMAGLIDCENITNAQQNEIQDNLAFMQWISENPAIQDNNLAALLGFSQFQSTSVASAATGVLLASGFINYDEPYLAPDLTKKTTVKLPKQKGSLNNPEALRVYPNPTSNYITIEFDLGDEASDALIEIIDASGKIVWVKKSNKSKNQLVADVQMLSTGNYLARLYSNRHLIASKTFVIYK
ncbi:hypothetical protein DSECCO2_481540 [anaerobic digester metagenome]